MDTAALAAGRSQGSDVRALVLQGLQFVVDNTFSPMVLSPARWGADVVVHSLTKFISGASDIVAGAHCCAPSPAGASHMSAPAAASMDSCRTK